MSSSAMSKLRDANGKVMHKLDLACAIDRKLGYTNYWILMDYMTYAELAEVYKKHCLTNK